MSTVLVSQSEAVKEPRALALDMRRDFVAFEHNAFAACQGLEQFKLDLTSIFWLRRRLPAPEKTPSYPPTFSFLVSLVLTDEAKRHLNLKVL